MLVHLSRFNFLMNFPHFNKKKTRTEDIFVCLSVSCRNKKKQKNGYESFYQRARKEKLYILHGVISGNDDSFTLGAVNRLFANSRLMVLALVRKSEEFMVRPVRR